MSFTVYHTDAHLHMEPETQHHIIETEDMDNPLNIIKSVYPNHSSPEATLLEMQRRIFSIYGIDVEELGLEAALQEAELSKPELDILCKGMIESEAEFLMHSAEIYNSVALRMEEKEMYKTMYVSQRPEELDDDTLYQNKLIRR